MANYSKFLSLISGVDRTVDLSLTSNILELGGGGLQMDGSTSGHVVISASATTSTYSMIWPTTQAASSGYVLTNDGTGVLSWSAAAATGVTSVSVTSTNGFAGTVANPTTTPAITISTSVTGILYGNGTSVATAIPSNFPTLNQNTTGTAANITATTNSTLTTLTALALPSADIFVGNGSNIATAVAVSGDIGIDNTGDTTVESIQGNTVSGTTGTGNVMFSASPSTTGTLTAVNIGATGSVQAGSLLLTGSTSGGLTQEAAATGSLYSVTWPNAQASGTQVLQNNGSGVLSWASAATGSVTSVSVVSTNGFAGTVATSTSTPAITIETTITGILQGNGTAISAATTTGSGNVVLSASPTLTGTITAAAASFSSAVNMGGNQINDLANPSLAQDAATKAYVDAAISGLTWQGPAQAYANSNVPLTGGATLTIDSYSVQNGDLVLLGNQTTASQNGEYSVSGIGTAYVLTANGLPTVVGDAWLVTNGTVYANSAFTATAVVPAAEFIEFAGPTSYSFTAPLMLTGNTVSITQANTSTNGYLTSTDWNTFNNKQPAGSYITALTGDATASGPGSATLTLATVNTNTGSFGSSTAIPSFTVNGKGLITAASTSAVVAPAGTLSGTTLNSTVVSSSLTSVGTLTSGVWNGTAIGPTFGGTGQSTYTTGDTLYASATNTLSKLGIGSTGQVLTVVSGLPAWAAPSVSPSSIALTDNHILVGNSSNLAADVAMSGDVAIVASGATTIQPGAVTATKLGAVTDGVTLDQSGAGSTLEVKAAGVSATQLATGAFDQITITGGAGTPASVAEAPSLKRTLVAGQSFSANTSYAVRWGITANSETAGRVYAADITTSSFDLFYVIGMASSGTAVSAGQNIVVTTMGSFSLSSSDTAFASTTDGEAVFLTATGTFSVTAPSSSGQAVTRIGMVQVRSATVTSNIIDVWPVVVGVN